MASDGRRPWMKFYPSDWRADPLLRSCEPLSRYVWLEMIGLMHEAEPYGHLIFAGRPMSPAALARMIAMDPADVEKALAELEAMGVFSRAQSGVIFSRRMVRDEEKHRRASNFGKRGVRAKALKHEDNEEPLEDGLEGGLEHTHEDSLEESREDGLEPRVQRPDSSSLSPPSGKVGKTEIPDDFEPEEFGEGTQSRAIVDGWTRLQFETQLEQFIAHHRREGSRYSDWQSAWSTWCINSRRFAEREASRTIGQQSGHSGKSFAETVIEEAAAEKAGAAAKPKRKKAGRT